MTKADTITANAPIPNTFGINAHATWFARPKSTGDLSALHKHEAWQAPNRLILGSGSNILFTKPYDGLIVQLQHTHFQYSPCYKDGYTLLHLGAHNDWHQVVMQTLQDGLHGLENLVGIPGTVGAAPVQNIGAYGTELSDCLVQLHAVHLETLEPRTFDKDACQFAYRNSYFKKNHTTTPWLITDVVLRLSNTPIPNLTHKQVKETLKEQGITHPTSMDIATCIYSLRGQKLPNPTNIGNAGSFFKNPMIDKDTFAELKNAYPTMPHFPGERIDQCKIPAAWLIEQCGWKGRRVGQTGTYKHHALVLVNHAKATGMEIWDAAQTIRQDVEKRFHITLEPEVCVL